MPLAALKRLIAESVASVDVLTKLKALSRGRARPAEQIALAHGIARGAGLVQFNWGTGRNVFSLGTDRVLKLASCASGIEQNTNELIRSKSFGSSGLLAQIFEGDSIDGIWLVMERVTQFESQRSFQLETGESFTAMMDYVYDKLAGEGDSRSPGPFADKLAALIAQAGIDPVEVDDVLQQWGTTAHGDVVLLDYGV